MNQKIDINDENGSLKILSPKQQIRKNHGTNVLFDSFLSVSSPEFEFGASKNIYLLIINKFKKE